MTTPIRCPHPHCPHQIPEPKPIPPYPGPDQADQERLEALVRDLKWAMR